MTTDVYRFWSPRSYGTSMDKPKKSPWQGTADGLAIWFPRAKLRGVVHGMLVTLLASAKRHLVPLWCGKKCVWRTLPLLISCSDCSCRLARVSLKCHRPSFYHIYTNTINNTYPHSTFCSEPASRTNQENIDRLWTTPAPLSSSKLRRAPAPRLRRVSLQELSAIVLAAAGEVSKLWAKVRWSEPATRANWHRHGAERCPTPSLLLGYLEILQVVANRENWPNPRGK